MSDAPLTDLVTTAAYLLAVVCTYKQITISRDVGGDTKFWIILTIALVLLGINKQLDLQTWLTEAMRDYARTHGWYFFRRPLQVAFIAILGFCMLFAIERFRVIFASSWRSHKLCWIGIVLLCTYVLLRTVSFHQFDNVINTHFLWVKVNVILELGALLLIILGTFYYKKPEYPITIITKVLKNHIEVSAEGDTVHCPQCAVEPETKAIDGGVFKCKSCGYKYSVRVVHRK